VRLVLLTLVLLLAAVVTAAAAGVRPHVELSDSMRPVLRAGDVLWLDGIRARDARPGEVVAFRHRGKLVLHRLRSVRGEGDRLALRTRGDANGAGESVTVARDAPLGRYVGVRVPAVGRLLLTVRSGPLAVAAALLLALLALRSIWRRA
jgi:signal peptidase I